LLARAILIPLLTCLTFASQNFKVGNGLCGGGASRLGSRAPAVLAVLAVLAGWCAVLAGWCSLVLAGAR
jgi:hypothetical protein